MMNWEYMTSGWMWIPMALLLALLALEITNDRYEEIRSALARAPH